MDFQLHIFCKLNYSCVILCFVQVIANMKEVMTMKDSEETDTTNLKSYLLDDLSRY